MAYNPALAIAYAHQWAFKRNPRYYDFEDLGGDCTNFISQCLHAGGFPMNYTPTTGWFYNSINSRTPSWSGVEELCSFIINNTGTGPKGVVGSIDQVKLGDVIQLNFGSIRYGHSLLVVGFEGSTPLITTHTNDSDNRPLSSYVYSTARSILF